MLSSVSKSTGSVETGIELAELGLTTRAKATLEAADVSIQKISGFDKSPELQLLLARIALERGDVKTALTHSQLAIDLGSNAAIRVNAIARILDTPESPAGAKAYIDGISYADVKTRTYYYEDLKLLLTDAEAEDWQHIPETDQARWLKAAWEWRASISTLPLHTRLAVHFQRIQQAFEFYPRRTAGGARPLGALWLSPALGELPLDDRGIVFVRHGGADDVVRATGGYLTQEAWYYRSLAGGRALLEFDKGNWYQEPPVVLGDYFLGEPFRCAYSLSKALVRGITLSPRELDRAKEKDRYRIKEHLADYAARIYNLDASLRPNDCYNTIAGDTGRILNRAATGENRRIASQAIMQTETATPRMKRPVDVLLNTYEFRRNGAPTLAVVMHVAAATLTPKGVGDYAFRVFAASEDPATRVVNRKDTVVSFNRTAPFQKDNVLRITTFVQPRIGRDITVRGAIQNANDSTQGEIVSTVRSIEGVNGAALSDVVIGSATESNWLEGTAAPNPIAGHRINENSEFLIFAEAYGMREGETVDIQLLIAPNARRSLKEKIEDLIHRREAVSVKFRDVAHLDPDGVLRIKRTLKSDALPGAYVLELMLTRSNGSTISSQTDMAIYSSRGK
jgi:hypothetical protein